MGHGRGSRGCLLLLIDGFEVVEESGVEELGDFPGCLSLASLALDFLVCAYEHMGHFLVSDFAICDEI